MASALASSPHPWTQGSCQVYAPCSANNGGYQRYRPSILQTQHRTYHSPRNLPAFRRSMPYLLNSTTGILFRGERGQRYRSRFTAGEGDVAQACLVDGVQPPISENLPAIARDTEESSTLKSFAGQPSMSAPAAQSTLKVVSEPSNLSSKFH